MRGKVVWKSYSRWFRTILDLETPESLTLIVWGCPRLRKIWLSPYGPYEKIVILGLLGVTFVGTYERQSCLESIVGLI